MKIILLQDLAGVGQRHATAEVAAGYGRNFIIARGYGLLATPANLARVEALKKSSRVTNIEATAGLAGAVIVIEAKANELGHLFASIHQTDISRAIKDQKNLVVDPESIQIGPPLKEVGEYELTAGEEIRFKLLIRPEPVSAHH